MTSRPFCSALAPRSIVRHLQTRTRLGQDCVAVADLDAHGQRPELLDLVFDPGPIEIVGSLAAEKRGRPLGHVGWKLNASQTRRPMPMGFLADMIHVLYKGFT